jgi:hypothetical protein
MTSFNFMVSTVAAALNRPHAFVAQEIRCFRREWSQDKFIVTIETLTHPVMAVVRLPKDWDRTSRLVVTLEDDVPVFWVGRYRADD